LLRQFISAKEANEQRMDQHIWKSLQYDSLKGAILEIFAISTETYQIHFRSVEWGENQSPKELLAQLSDLCFKWLKPKKHTVEPVIDFIILEQLFQGSEKERTSQCETQGHLNESGMSIGTF
uniref:SCAN box domain-containing protein n=1 Tax=Erpetoichthys calabaricus TaxID=27687 RepID=A0A8C4X554_ERPCA